MESYAKLAGKIAEGIALVVSLIVAGPLIFGWVWRMMTTPSVIVHGKIEELFNYCPGPWPEHFILQWYWMIGSFLPSNKTLCNGYGSMNLTLN